MKSWVRSGTLYIVPTPIGNLSDITQRAIEVLKQVDLVACEDTRRTAPLLTHLGISRRLVSYHAHSGSRKEDLILDALRAGQTVALVSDAGTPGLSDPGEPLIRRALDDGLSVSALPGPCAAITALVASGLPTDRFFFIGFLPRRPARARRLLSQAAASGSTVVIYESPFRTRQTLQQIRDIAGDSAPAAVARELTKIHEEILRGTVSDILARLGDQTPRGEVVIMFRTPQEEKEEQE